MDALTASCEHSDKKNEKKKNPEKNRKMKIMQAKNHGPDPQSDCLAFTPENQCK